MLRYKIQTLLPLQKKKMLQQAPPIRIICSMGCAASFYSVHINFLAAITKHSFFGENSRLCPKPHYVHLLVYLNSNDTNGVLTYYLVCRPRYLCLALYFYQLFCVFCIFCQLICVFSSPICQKMSAHQLKHRGINMHTKTSRYLKCLILALYN